MPTPAPDKATQQEVRRLLKRLARLKGDWPSEPSLSDLHPQMAEALLNHITNQVASNNGIRQSTMAMLVLFWMHVDNHKHYLPAFVPGIATILLVLIWNFEVHHSRYAVYALTQTRDIRILPTLINATRYKWGRHPDVSNAINRLLEQITEADTGLLSDQAQQRLWSIRVGWQTSAEQHDPQVAISVLRALAAVGNHASYTRMERLANRSERFAQEREVIAAAQELLPLMQVRFQRQEVPQTLLRAVTSETPADKV